MEGRRGDAVMFAWGAAEALSYPVTAEMSQVFLGVVEPEKLWRRAAAVTAGSVTGIAINHLLSRSGRSLPTPWTPPRMRQATSRYLDKGPRGYWQQALTGIPVKLFAAESGRRDLPLGRVLLHAVGERGLRMAASTAAISALSKPVRPLVRQHYGVYVLTIGAVYAVLLRGVVRYWED